MVVRTACYASFAFLTRSEVLQAFILKIHFVFRLFFSNLSEVSAHSSLQNSKMAMKLSIQWWRVVLQAVIFLHRTAPIL